MFDSNADKVKRGNDDARRSTDDLESSLRSADGAGIALGQSLMATFAELGAGLLAGLGLDKIKDEITGLAELDAQLGLTSKRLNIGVEDLSAWEHATILAGGASGEFTQSLDFLNRGMATIATTGTSRLKPFFDELKIKVTDAPHHVRPLLDILLDLSDAAHKMGSQQFAGVAERLGLGPGLTLLVQSGRNAIGDLVRQQKELGVATAESAARAMEYRTANIELDDAFENLYRRMGSAVIPALTDFFKWAVRIVEYLEQHRSLVEGFFIGVGAAIGTYYLPAIIEAAVATIAAIGPYLLLAAAVVAIGAAFALAYDDVENFLAGNKSVLGELMTRYPEVFAAVSTVLRDTAATIEWFVQLGVAGFNLLSAVWNGVVGAITGQLRAWGADLVQVGQILETVVGILGKIFPEWKAFFEGVGALVDWLLDKFKTLVGYLGGNALTTAFGALRELWAGVKTAPQFLQGAADFINDPTGVAIGAGRGILAGAAASSYNVAPAAAGARSNTVHIENLNIATPQGTDPASWSDAISRELQRQLRDTANHFDDGVDR